MNVFTLHISVFFVSTVNVIYRAEGSTRSDSAEDEPVLVGLHVDNSDEDDDDDSTCGSSDVTCGASD